MYPAKSMSKYLGDKLSKIIFGLIGVGIWIGVYFLGAVVINFILVNIVGKKDSTIETFVRSEVGLWILLIGIFIVFWAIWFGKKRSKN